MTERRAATTIGELDIHLSHVQSGLARLAESVERMATKQDIDGIRLDMAHLATKAELEAKVRAVQEQFARESERLQRESPSRIGTTIVKIAGGLTVIGAAIVLLGQVFKWAGLS